MNQHAQTIFQLVTDIYGVTVEQMQGRRRTKSIALARNICMFLLRRNTRLCCWEIGEMFGMRDSTTVSCACSSIQSRTQSDAALAMELYYLQEQIERTA